MAQTQSKMQTILINLVKFYQTFISPMKAPSCRFTPTCSQYAVEAIKIHGSVKGSWLSVKRLLKCHPLHPGGSDPVPESKSQPENK